MADSDPSGPSLVTEGPETPRRPRVLVADDSESLRLVVRITVESQDWVVLETTTGAETLQLARAQHPDLILLDLDFANGGPQGLTVLRELRASPDTVDIPVIVLTASDRPADEVDSAAAGAAAYLTKPFGPIALITVMRHVLGNSLRAEGLGLYLVNAGALSAAQLSRALARQREREALGEHVALGTLLVEQGAISESELSRALGEQRDQATALASGRTTIGTEPTTVLIVDDHPAVRAGLRALLADAPDLRIVGEAADGREALALGIRLRPEVVVLDQEMPDLRGLDVLKRLRALLPTTRVVMFTTSREVEREAQALGATAFVSKDSPEGVLLGTLRTAAGRTAPAALPPPSSRDAPARFRREPIRVPWRSLGLLSVVLAGYGLGFLIAETALGASAAILGIVPVALAGALLGPELGVVAAIAVDLMTFQLWELTDHHAGETLLQIGGTGLGALSLLFLGATFGAMRLRADRSRSREAALGHAIVDPGGPAELLAAARSIVLCDAAVLVRLSADQSELELVHSVGIELFPARFRLTEALPLARCIRELAPTLVRGPVPGISTETRAVVAVPIVSTAGRALGILALLDRKAAAFHDNDLRPLRALAAAASDVLGPPVLRVATQPARGS